MSFDNEASGAQTFRELTDTPSSFAGHAGKVAAVNVGETALEFVAVAGTGTVTSVGLSLPGIFTVTNSPVTTAGTLTGSLTNQNANLVFSGPSSGSPAAPTFRALVLNDLPSIAESTLLGNPTGSVLQPQAMGIGDGLGLNGTNLIVSFGTGSSDACVGNDSRLSDARTPTLHASTHATAGSDPIAAGDIGAATAAQGVLAITSGNTGIITGGALTINGGDPTKIDIAAGSGYVIDDSVNPPTASLVTWSAFTAVTLTDLATESSTDIAINAAGSVVQQRRYTNTELRSVILLGGVDHAGGTVNKVFSIQVPSFAPGLSVRDLARAIGDINLAGNVFAPAGTDLTVTKNVGQSFSFGRNAATSKTDPHVISQPSIATVSFNYIYQDGAGGTTVGTTVSAINPANFDDGDGTLGSVPTNDFAYQNFLLFPNSNSVFVQYGTVTFNTMKEAIEGLSTTTFPQLPGFTSAMRRGVLIVRQGATNLANTASARFFSADKFGSIAGAVGPGAVSYGDMLASVYDPTSIAADAFARANHTGTQTASTISDFDTAVAANSAVAANTAKVTNATHTGDVTGATELTIANDAVTNAKAANMAEATIKGRAASAGTGDPTDLTASQVRTILNVADGATANAGTVTSVAATVPTGLTISGSPVTTSGTLAIGLDTGRVIPLQSTLDGKQAADADLTAVAGLTGTGLATRTAADTWATRSVAGTTNRIALTNGDGVAGNPTVDIDSNYAGQSTITTLGTVATGTWAATAVGTQYGGTGLNNSALAADRYLYTNGTGTFTNGTITTFGRSLIDDADNTTARTTLGLGTIATQAANSVSITGGSISGITDIAVADGGTGSSTAAGARTNLGTASRKRTVSFTIDGSGTALTTGTKGYLPAIPYAGTIVSWRIVAKESGSIVFDVWKANAAVPTNANSITASAKPTLSSAQIGSSSTLTGWTTSVAVNDVFGVEIESATTITQATLVLEIEETHS